MVRVGEDDVMLKVLHTADWHLGRRFRSFPEEGAKKLSRARMEVLDRILLMADRHAVDAILCAGDLFDEPEPSRDWWEGLALRLKKTPSDRPIFLLPGNHDPLIAQSVWAKDHKFRTLLPEWVHVVDRQDFQYTFPNGSVLYAVPCMSKAGQSDPTESIPKRTPGEERIRIGMVHGSTFDAKDWQTNFPIHPDAAVHRELDYLAIGDTHGFRFVPPDRMHPPTIYPGTPEPTAFDEKDPGYVALVFFNRQRRATVRREAVGHWTWEEVTVASIAQLRDLARRQDLSNRVLRVQVDMCVPAPEYDEAIRLLEDLEGTEARHGKAGVVDIDRHGLSLETSTVDQYCADLPDVLQSTVTRLKSLATEPDQRDVAERALFHLYRSSKRKAS